MKKILQFFMVCFVTLTGNVSWASDQIKIITTSPAGGNAVDIIARKVADIYKANTGRDMIVANIPGGDNIPAAQEFKKQSLAVIFAATPLMVYNYANKENLPYTHKDFNVLFDLGLNSHVIFTHKNSGINSLEDLVNGRNPIQIGVSDLAALATVNAWRRQHNPNLVIVNYKNQNELLINTRGQHIPVGLVPISNDLVFDWADSKDMMILGHTGTTSILKRNYSMRPASRILDSPAFFGGLWVAITPGESVPHVQLGKDIIEIFNRPDIKDIIKVNWPIRAEGNHTLEKLQQRALNNKDLLILK